MNGPGFIPIIPVPVFLVPSPFAPKAQEFLSPAKANRGKDAPRGEARRHAWKARKRRTLRLSRAKDALGALPQEGEATHLIFCRYFDLVDLLAVIVRAAAVPCALTCSTLSYSKRAVRGLATLLDDGALTRVTLLCADFMAKANGAVHAYALEELRDKRGATVATARTHCKVFCLSFADGTELVLEGSANIHSARDLENVAVINDRGLAEFHRQWIAELVGTGAQRLAVE